MSASLDALIPELQPFARELIRAAGAAGLQPRVTSTLRSRTEQTRLYRRFLAGAAQYPVAPPGTSAHEYGYAFDMVVSPLEELGYSVARYWLQLGGVWHASDAVHFEYPGFREDLASGLLGPPLAKPPAFLTTAADIVSGSGLASAAEALGAHNSLIESLAHPVETLQPSVDEFVTWMRRQGLLQ